MSDSRAFFDKDPCEAWHGTAEIGSPEWSEQVTAQRYFVQPHIPRFAQFDRWKGKRVLEIGCGTGTDTLEFLKNGAQVDAVEFSVRSRALAERRLDFFDKNNSALIWLADAEQFLPHGTFDLIYSFGVLHHTSHPTLVLNRAFRRLALDGELRIMLYAKYSWKNFWGMQPEAAPGCPHVKWYSKHEARKLLESCGFKVVSIRKTHIFPWRIKEYRMHLYKKAFPWSVTPQWLFRWLESRIGHHLLLVAVKQ